ncbi:MAG: hypothetical protein ACRDD7_07600 [Peptostreptococcaceae bacterium]
MQQMKMVNKKIILVMGVLVLGIFSFLTYYRLFVEIQYTPSYETSGIILSIKSKNDESYYYKELEIKYCDSEENEIIDKHEIYENSDEYKIFEDNYDMKVGEKIKIETEEGVAEGFLGKRLLYSIVSRVLAP